MATILQFLLSLVVLLNFVKTAELFKEYDDPASDAYKELKKDFLKFEFAIIKANFKRPKGQTKFFLKPKEKSCINRCNETRDVFKHYCHCDRLCALYKDCCIDYWPKCNVKTKPFKQSTQELWQCVDAKYKIAKSNRTLHSIAYMMINRCPTTNITTNQSYDDDCIPLGTNRTGYSQLIPVSGDDGRTYRNEHCAKCHGITNITHWGLMVACLDPVKNGTSLAFENAYLHENCTWYLSPGNENASSVIPCRSSTLCKSVVTTTESSKYKDLINKCKVYSQLVYADTILYKNFHCASCNGKDVMLFKEPGELIKEKPSLSLFFDYKSFSGGDPDNGLPVKESTDDVIHGYLTEIGLSLSITCLLAVVLTYVRFPTLRTVPGLVLLALSLSLLAYQSLLLASSHLKPGTPGCKALAVSLHFMILLAFTWMTVMSYDVAKTFSRKGKSSSRSLSRSSFRRYVIVAISISVVIVALAFTLGKTGVVDIGYGGSSCWINKLLALIIFFYIPVGIMLLFNAVSLTWTIFSIRNVTKLTKGVQKSGKTDTRGQNAKIYSKLSTVMGITWFLGFGAAHNTIVAYLYIIINSLQGVFIFITFVLNKRTMNMWRNTASTLGGGSSTSTRKTRASKFNKNMVPYASTNQLTTADGNKKQQEQELSFTKL